MGRKEHEKIGETPGAEGAAGADVAGESHVSPGGDRNMRSCDPQQGAQSA